MNKFDLNSDIAHSKTKSFIVFSYISPESIANCSNRLIKFRGVYDTYDDAVKASKEFNVKCNFFDMVIAETGGWFDVSYNNKHSDHFMSSDNKMQEIYDAEQASDENVANEYIKMFNRDNETVKYRSKDNIIVNSLNNKLLEHQSKLDELKEHSNV